MQNEEEKLFHQLSWRRIWVSYTLTFGVNLPYHINYLHHFCCREISHACHVVFCCPWRTQFQPLRQRLWTVFLRTIIGHHQILEIIEDHWEKAVDAACLGIAVKIIYYLICLENIAVHYGVAQFERVEVLTHAYLFLHRLESLGGCRQADQAAAYPVRLSVG